MKRDLQALTAQEFDVLVVGGGVHGAFTALECARRGMKTAVIDKADFCGATSANSLKIVHGGLRYLQQADIKRVRDSVCARRDILRAAPHLVSPFPCMLPTSSKLMRSRAVMGMAMLANDILTADRNCGVDSARHIARGKVLSLKELNEVVPSIPAGGYTGAAVWNDAYAYDSERLVVGAVRAATERGAVAANYIKVTGFLGADDSVRGVRAQDALSGDEIEIRSRLVINNTGPWARELLGQLGRPVSLPESQLALGLNFVLNRKISERHAIAIDSVPTGSTKVRSFFFLPWRDTTIAGTYYRAHDGACDDIKITDRDIEIFLSDLNGAWPDGELKREDITMMHAGLLPSLGAPAPGAEPRMIKHALRIDHRKDGIAGLMTVQGIKYTTGWSEAVHTACDAAKRLGIKSRDSEKVYLPGGRIESVSDLLKSAQETPPTNVPPECVQHLVSAYGSEYVSVVDEGDNAGLSREPYAGSCVLPAEIVHAVRVEMAQTLGDAVFRRTGLASAAIPDESVLAACAQVMASELGWDDARVEKEIKSVQNSVFPGADALQ